MPASLSRSSRLSSTIKHRVISTCPSSHMSTFRSHRPDSESCVATVNAELTSYPQLFGTEIIRENHRHPEFLFSTYPQLVKTGVSDLFANLGRLRGNRTAKERGRRTSLIGDCRWPDCGSRSSRSGGSTPIRSPER